MAWILPPLVSRKDQNNARIRISLLTEEELENAPKGKTVEVFNGLAEC